MLTNLWSAILFGQSLAGIRWNDSETLTSFQDARGNSFTLKTSSPLFSFEVNKELFTSTNSSNRVQLKISALIIPAIYRGAFGKCQMISTKVGAIGILYLKAEVILNHRQAGGMCKVVRQNFAIDNSCYMSVLDLNETQQWVFGA
jgi:hypothetical protein